VILKASTVSETDCTIRKGDRWVDGDVPLPIIPGVDLVGKVQEIGNRTSSRFNLGKGDRVLSLVKTGGNARFARVRPEQLVRIPDSVDGTQAVCLVETYLTAFQLLHFEQRPPGRYRKMTGKSILVLGAMTTVGRAVIELANHVEVSLIYAWEHEKHRDAICAMGATPLGRNVDEWMSQLADSLDLIVDTTKDSTKDNFQIAQCLRSHGSFVFIGNRLSSLDPVQPVHGHSTSRGIKLLAPCSRKGLPIDRVYAYDVFYQWWEKLEECKRDLSHLVSLLEGGVLNPNIVSRVPLNKVARAQAEIEEKQIYGFIVCEPWIKCVHRAVYL